MSRRMTAAQLISAAAACVVCGKEHKPRKAGGFVSWASPADGHAYRSRLYAMTGYSHSPALEALRVLAAEGDGGA